MKNQIVYELNIIVNPNMFQPIFIGIITFKLNTYKY